MERGMLPLQEDEMLPPTVTTIEEEDGMVGNTLKGQKKEGCVLSVNPEQELGKLREKYYVAGCGCECLQFASEFLEKM